MRKEDEVLSELRSKDGGHGMKLTVKTQGEIIKTIKAEYSPAEMTVIFHAMWRYTNDEGVSEKNRKLMRQMLKVEPVEEEGED